MQLTDFIHLDLIRHNIHFSSKKRAFEVIGKIATDFLNLCESSDESDECFNGVECFSSLLKREKLGSTYLGNGVALPHSKLSEWNIEDDVLIAVDHPIAIFLKLESPIDYGEGESKSVDIICAVIFPEIEKEECKTTLKFIAEKLQDKQLLKQLRASQSIEEIWHIFGHYDKLAEETVAETLQEEVQQQNQ